MGLFSGTYKNSEVIIDWKIGRFRLTLLKRISCHWCRERGERGCNGFCRIT